MLKAIIDLAHNLDLPVVAEGVEHLDVAILLHQMGCEMAQGYFFSRPIPENAMLDWIRNYRS
jgi:EAL domain-containing protein (putative c-di-GMP-specific phosphodiesterase class I)